MKLEDLRTLPMDYAELARLMGYSRNHVNEVALGKRKPTKKFILILERIAYSELSSKWAERAHKKKNFKNS